MNSFAFSSAASMLDRFEAEPRLLGEEADRLIQLVLGCCGYEITRSGFVENHDRGVDCYFVAPMDGRNQRVGVEIKSYNRRIGTDVVDRALAIAKSGRFDRNWIISRGGFKPEAERRAETLGLGRLDLLTTNDLRNWIAKHSGDEGEQRRDTAIIRQAMQELAREIALDPGSLYRREWRDLERILREVFERIGFATRLTRPGKDGGFDLELSLQGEHGRKAYLVEVKHWTEQRPGSAALKKLVKISIEQAVEGAILLSTSGFTRTISSGLLEACAPPIRLGDDSKIISLCKTYYRLSTGYWLEEPLPTLYSGTSLVQQPASLPKL